jgi:hypothetical protein
VCVSLSAACTKLVNGYIYFYYIRLLKDFKIFGLHLYRTCLKATLHKDLQAFCVQLVDYPLKRVFRTEDLGKHKLSSTILAFLFFEVMRVQNKMAVKKIDKTKKYLLDLGIFAI